MKKITIYLVMLLMGFSGYSQVEYFDDASVVAPVTPGPWVLPSGTWQIFDNGVGPTVNWNLNPQGTYPAYSGTKCAYMDRMNIGANNTSEDYLVTPLLSVPTNAQLRFFTRTTIAGQSTPNSTIYQIRSAPATADPTLPASFTTIVKTWTENELTDDYDVWEEKILDITDPVGSQMYYAFVRVFTQPTAAPNGDRWLVDDFKFVEKCLDVTDIVPACLSTSASLSWTSPGPATQWAVHVLPADAEFDPNAGTPYIATTNTNFVVDHTTQPTETPMLPITDYVFYIRALCEDSPSDWVSIECTTQALPPECGGSYVDNGGVDGEYLGNSNDIVTICPDNPTDQVTVTFTDFNTENGWDGIYVFDGNSINANIIASDNDSGFNEDLSTPGAWWGNAIPGPFTSTSPDGCLTFQFISDGFGNFDGWLASVTCNPPPACPEPGALTIDVTATTATLGWTNVGPGTAWEVIALPCGAPAPTADTVGTIVETGSSYTFDPLIPGTCYDFYVRANCESSSNGISDWNGPISEMTDVLPPECGGNYVDNGGLGSDYASGSDEVTVICPENPGDYVTVIFTQFDTDWGSDGIYVYDGNSTDAPMIPSENEAGFSVLTEPGAYWGTDIPGPFESTSPDGCLTFHFLSDDFFETPGFLANVVCAPILPCAKPVNFEVTGTTSYGATLTWDAGAGTSWQVLALPCGSPAPDASAGGIPTTEPTFVFTDELEADTCYDFYVRTNCTADGNGFSYWTFPQSASTQVAPPVCGGQYTDNGGLNNTYLPNSNSIVTVCPEAGEIVIVTFTAFDVEQWGGDGLYVFDGPSTDSPLIPSENEATWNLPLDGAYWGTEIPGPFESTSPDGCLTFQFISDGFGELDGYVADVACVPAPTCPKPTNVTHTVPTNDSVTVSWVPNGPATQWKVYVLPCDDPAPTAATPGGVPADAPTATVTDLIESTCYKIWVISICSDTDASNPTMPQTITTQVDPPVCGGIFYDAGGPDDNYPESSDSIVTVCPENPGEIVQIVWTSFDTEAQIDGLYVYDGPSTSSPQISSDNPANTFGVLTEPGAFWGSELPYNFESSSPDGCLTFHFLSDNFFELSGWEANVNCIPAPTCPKPFEVSIVDVSTSDVTVDWTPQGTATQWEVIVLPASDPAPDASAVGQITSDHPYTYGPIDSGTQYKVYVRAICSDEDKSSWTYPIPFVTLITNDECSTATVVPVNPTPTCVESVSGTLIGATDSGVTNNCFGSSDDDVWFQFTATGPNHAISLQNINQDFPSINFAVYANGCDALELVQCFETSEGLVTGLIPDQTYYIQVYSMFEPDPTYSFDLCITTLLPPITTAPMGDDWTPQQLIQDILIGNDCAIASNITTSTGIDFGSAANGIGYFNKNGSSFQFDEGVILSSGSVDDAPGPNIIFPVQSAGTEMDDNFNYLWPGDDDLEAIILEATGEAMNSNNASIVEFDFVPITPSISFNFIFASEEYGDFQCSFSDAFAFLLTDTSAGTPAVNLAVLPNSTTPVSVVTIRDSAYNNSCDSVNPQYFDEYYVLPEGIGGLGAPINFDGVTVPLAATATVVPGNTYHIKLVIADRQDASYDSAVFLEGGSFSSGEDLFPDDLLQENLTALCPGGSYTLDTGLSPDEYTFIWSDANGVIESATGPTLVVTQPGQYHVDAHYLSTTCGPSGDIVIEFFPDIVLTPDVDLVRCNETGYAEFDLSEANIPVLGTLDPADYTMTYYLTADDAANEFSPLPNLYTNVVQNLQTIYVRAETAAGCFAIIALDLVVNLNPPAIVPVDDVSACESYTLGTPEVGHFYFEADGQGAIADGATITDTANPTMIYLYAGTSGCSSQDTFTVTILDQLNADVLPSTPANCSFELPVLSANNTYWTLPGGPSGGGTQLFAGGIISTTQDIFIYAVSPGCDPTESSFTVTVTPAPVLDAVGDLSDCESITLPSLSVGSYYTDAEHT
ncbi:choice-of-anchor L domain-containing protein, partial [Flavobacterium silvaticum]